MSNLYKTYIPLCVYLEHNSLCISQEGKYLQQMLQGIMEHAFCFQYTFFVIRGIEGFEVTMKEVISIFPNLNIQQSGKAF
jgi:hypothetical protein